LFDNFSIKNSIFKSSSSRLVKELNFSFFSF